MDTHVTEREMLITALDTLLFQLLEEPTADAIVRFITLTDILLHDLSAEYKKGVDKCG